MHQTIPATTCVFLKNIFSLLQALVDTADISFSFSAPLDIIFMHDGHGKEYQLFKLECTEVLYIYQPC